MTDRRDIPYRFEPTATAAGLHGAHGDLAAGEESGVRATVAGRLMLRRTQGRLCFGTLDDAGGRIQLFAPAAVTPAYDDFCALSIGDWVGATGEVMKTRPGRVVGQGGGLEAAGRGTPSPSRQVARHRRRRHPVPAALRSTCG